MRLPSSLRDSDASVSSTIHAAADQQALMVADAFALDIDDCAAGIAYAASLVRLAPTSPGEVLLDTSASNSGVDSISLTSATEVTYVIPASLYGVELEPFIFTVDQDSEGTGDSIPAVLCKVYGALEGGGYIKAIPGQPVVFPSGAVATAGISIKFTFTNFAGTARARILWTWRHKGRVRGTGVKAAQRRNTLLSMGADVGSSFLKKAASRLQEMEGLKGAIMQHVSQVGQLSGPVGNALQARLAGNKLQLGGFRR